MKTRGRWDSGMSEVSAFYRGAFLQAKESRSTWLEGSRAPAELVASAAYGNDAAAAPTNEQAAHGELLHWQPLLPFFNS